jgi:hypothetical protein
MKTLSRLALALVAALTVSTSSFAGVIVDTGAGSVPYGSGFALVPTQWLANSFTLAQRETITGVNGWIGGTTGNLQIAIRSAVNGLPGQVLYTADATPELSFVNAWVGASGLDWTLDAGTYFLAFQVPDGYTYRGGMGGNIPSPSGTEAFTDELGKWHSDPYGHIGFQVFGEPANVPEPSTVALTGLALAALALSRRKRA